MPDFPEILSLKAMLHTMLSKVEAMEKKMEKKPSKRATDKQARIDRELTRQRKIIARSQYKKIYQ